MLWKQLSPGYRRLIRKGSKGQAVVVEVKEDRQKNSRIGGIYGWTVTIRVKFADGSTADYERYLEAAVVTDEFGRSVLEPEAGMVLPIRFDPTNRSKVEIDTVGLAEQHASAQARADAEVTSAQSADASRAVRELKPLDS